MTQFINFIEDILQAGRSEHYDVENSRRDTVKELIEKHFTDDVLSDITVETGGHNDLEMVMTLGEIERHYESLGRGGRHMFTFDNIRRRLIAPTGCAISSCRAVITRTDPDKTNQYTETDVVDDFLLMSDIDNRECRCCGNKPQIALDLNAGGFKVKGSSVKVDCPAKKMAPETFQFNAPSGKVVVANNLLSVLPELNMEYGEPNYDDYAKKSQPYYQARGAEDVSRDSLLAMRANRDFFLQEYQLVWIETFNIAPVIYAGDGFIKIRRELEEFDDDTDLEELNDYEMADYIEAGELKPIAEIETELWAVHLMDYDVFCQHAKDRGIDPDKTLKELKAVVLDAPEHDMAITDYMTMPGVDEGNILIATIDFSPKPTLKPTL